MTPKISIVIPTYNRADFLKEAIDSALSQDYPNFEIIISDNASQDNTPSIVKEYAHDKRVKYFRNNTNIGMVKNWQRAVYEHVSGDWFLILSDDDYLVDINYLTKAVNLINKDRDIALVYANGFIRYEPEGKEVPLQLPFSGIVDGGDVFLSRGQVRPQDFTLCNILFNYKKSIVLKPFLNPKNISCDSELFLKLCLRGKVAVVNDYVSVYRIHGKNIILEVTTDFDLLLNNLEFIVNPYIDAWDNDYLCKDKLDKFRAEAVLPAVNSVILLAALNYNERYAEVISFIKGNGHLFDIVFQFSNYNLLIKLTIIKMRCAIYKLIYKLKV